MNENDNDFPPYEPKPVLQVGGRTGLVVRASDSGSGDRVRSSAGSVCCFLEQETFTPQKYWKYPGIGGSV